MTIRFLRLYEDHIEDIDGYVVGHNLDDVLDLPLNRFGHFIWWWFTRNGGDPGEIAKFRSELWRPPRGTMVTDSSSPWSPESETAALKAFAAEMNR